MPVPSLSAPSRPLLSPVRSPVLWPLCLLHAQVQRQPARHQIVAATGSAERGLETELQAGDPACSGQQSEGQAVGRARLGCAGGSRGFRPSRPCRSLQGKHTRCRVVVQRGGGGLGSCLVLPLASSVTLSTARLLCIPSSAHLYNEMRRRIMRMTHKKIACL